MSLDDLVGLLARVPAFAGMGRGPLVYIAQYAIPRYFDAGDVLFNEGQAGEGAYLIIYGNAVTVTESGEAIERDTGELIGEMAMLTDAACPYTCVARSQLTVLEIPRKMMHRLLAQDPAALAYTRDRLSRRIAEIHENLRLVEESLAAYAVPGEARMDEPKPATAGFVDGYAATDDMVSANGASRNVASRHGAGEAGPAPGSHEPAMAPEFAHVLRVLGPLHLPGSDQNGQAPEYDRTELPSPWPYPPAAA